MKKIFVLALLVFAFTASNSQEKSDNQIRTIEVTGSAEIEIEADEIIFGITYQEYWVEEFEKGLFDTRKNYDDYETKFPIEKIENELLDDLYQAGVVDEQITLQNIGNHWRSQGKEFLIKKTIFISITDFKQIEKITEIVNPRGIASMGIKELKNKELEVFRKEVKIQALRAAKEKAEYLLDAIDEDLGRVISIKETTNQSVFQVRDMMSNRLMSAESSSANIENLRKIKLRYEVFTVFEIE